MVVARMDSSLQIELSACLLVCGVLETVYLPRTEGKLIQW
jgi:hypothetical protein